MGKFFSFANKRSERINIKKASRRWVSKTSHFYKIDYVLYDCMGFLLECDVCQMFLVVWFI